MQSVHLSEVHSSHIPHVHRERALFCKDTFQRCPSGGSTVESRAGEVTRCRRDTFSYTNIPYEQNRTSEGTGSIRLLPWRCLSQTQNRPHLLQTRKSDISGFQFCYNCNMYFSFKFMNHPSSFMQFYFKLKWIITITFGEKNFTMPFEVAKHTTGHCKTKAENHCFGDSVNWFLSPSFSKTESLLLLWNFHLKRIF